MEQNTVERNAETEIDTNNRVKTNKKTKKSNNKKKKKKRGGGAVGVQARLIYSTRTES